MQSSIFQPKGGMGLIGKAFGKELEPLIQYNCQGHRHPPGRQGRHRHLYRQPHGRRARAPPRADWCVCTIPASILSQIPMNVGGPMKAAIDQLPYHGGAEGRACR